MKKHWKCWWSANVFWIILFVIAAAVIWLRESDAAGVTQTPEIKLITVILLLIGGTIPVIIQVVWRIVMQEVSKSARTSNHY